MKEIKLNIFINKPVEVCFAYTLNSKNTPKYFTSMKEEVSNEFPVKLGTRLKNTYNGIDWDEYEVIDFLKNKTFTLSRLNSTYHVKYTFEQEKNGTNFEYYEWVEVGKLADPTTINTLELLKENLESE